ncbi:hypothetical protein GBAR_LOCUS8086 [Geodia barretti]|uniref:Uncharacterized protein n=1 Tax=Geodia barretti TaxID=519541 RepID=A0AA35W9R7_GEOBA|nr:hypothetical protein GBAR_LOCUS8086 [Geodia barretti]
MEWDAADGGVGGLSYKIRFYSGQSFGSTPSSQRIVLSSPTNSLSFTDQDVPTQRPLYAIIKGRNSNGVHSTSWSTPIVAAEIGCP